MLIKVTDNTRTRKCLIAVDESQENIIEIIISKGKLFSN